MKKFRILPLLLLWAGLAAAAWFGPERAVSEAERRPLAQMPAISGEAVLSGTFMDRFESYSLDQFPLRDGFRQLKSLFHYGVLGQRDVGGIYLTQGYAVKQEYPLREDSVAHALDRFRYLYDSYLQDCRVFAAVVPDKGYFLGGGNLQMDYERLLDMVRTGMPWAEHIDLADTLTGQDYYRTDTHWRQERLLPTAQKIADALGVRVLEDTAPRELHRSFYGVYYGQAALPMAPDSLTILESGILDGCTVYDYETGKSGPVYDLARAEGRDPYEVFLSGPKSLLTIENPAADTDRELIVFRDSFGSALVPLLVRDYARVTLVDIRYVQSPTLGRFLDFRDQDVLFLYSTLVLNNSNTMK
ncbi:MAG: DHHW family protein [Eubacteriales bacterium]|nr:DHHW family protein [Eubacteriales bacterium]